MTLKLSYVDKEAPRLVENRPAVVERARVRHGTGVDEQAIVEDSAVVLEGTKDADGPLVRELAVEDKLTLAPQRDTRSDASTTMVGSKPVTRRIFSAGSKALQLRRRRRSFRRPRSAIRRWPTRRTERRQRRST